MQRLEDFVVDYYNLKHDNIEDEDYQVLLKESFDNKNLFILSEKSYNKHIHEFNVLDKRKLNLFKDKLILETLKSYNADIFANAFKKKFSNEFDILLIRTVDNDDESLNRKTAFEIIYNVRTKDDAKLFNKHKNEIIDMCKFYKYFITIQYNNYGNANIGLITFEPLVTKEVTKLIKTKFNNKIYHLTNVKNVESIKKYGLYISGPHAFSDSNDPMVYIRQSEIYKRTSLDKYCDENTIRDNIRKSITYRNFPDRTFVFYTYLDAVEAGKFLVNELHKKHGDYCVIEIDLSIHNNPIFQDTMMKTSDEIFYGYSNIDIPKDMISNIHYLK